MTHGVLPEGVAFQGARLKDGRYRFTYSESFNDRRLAERTADLLRHAFKALADSGLRVGRRLTRDGGSFTIKGTVTSETLGNMLAGEFIGWSSLGAMRLRDLLAQAVVVGAGGVSSGGKRRGLDRPNAADRKRAAESMALPDLPPGFHAEFVEVGGGVGDLSQIDEDKVPEKFLAQKAQAGRKP